MKPHAKLTTLPSTLLATLVTGGSNPVYAGAGTHVSNAGGGNASPLYDAKGLDVEAALRTIALAD